MRVLSILALVAGFAASASAMPFESQLDLPRDYRSHRQTQMVALEAGQTFTLFEEDGPGAITHIWMTLGKNDVRQVVIRMYWDGEEDPSVEAPIADFFGVGHNRLEPEEYFSTPALVVAPSNGYNLYMPMPFRKSAKITVTNDQDHGLNTGGGLYFQADYLRYEELAETTPYFHAQWRRESPAQRRGRLYTVIEAVGRGFLAGVTYHVRIDDPSDKWFHGGGDTLYLDGGSSPHIIKGIGGEDFFGESWQSAAFNSPYSGVTSHRNGRISMYRFFLEGPPRFEESMRFAFGAMANEITSVGYWYQTEPHRRFYTLPDVARRSPESEIKAGEFDVELLPGQQVNVAIIGPLYGDIDTRIPLDAQAKLDFSLGMLTNYGAPYKDIIPNNDNRRIQWERTRTRLSWIDFDAAYKPKMVQIFGVKSMPGALAYACVRIHTDTARPGTLVLGHDDAVRVWLNGKLIANPEGGKGFSRRSIALELSAGSNDLLIKAANTWNVNWAANALSIRFEGLEGLRFDAFEELPATLDSEN